jgi:hypothetical protein
MITNYLPIYTCTAMKLRHVGNPGEADHIAGSSGGIRLAWQLERQNASPEFSNLVLIGCQAESRLVVVELPSCRAGHAETSCLAFFSKSTVVARSPADNAALAVFNRIL